jgi:hypothetical protein
MIGLGKVAINITEGKNMVIDDVGPKVLVDERRAGLHGAEGVDHRWQRLPVNFNQVKGVLSDGAALGSDSDHCFAGIAHFLDGDGVFDSGLSAESRYRTNDLGGLLAREHSLHSRQSTRRAGVDGPNAGMSIGTAQNGGVQPDTASCPGWLEESPGFGLRIGR